jgi:predicted  nucleic acid-binding Zn-ribbon protein
MAARKEQSIDEKLKNLYLLQLIDSELDEIEVLKGELPKEVEDLEDRIAGLETRLARVQGQAEDLEKEIRQHDVNIETAKTLIERYEGQMDNVKNNREYEALMKEQEMQRLEIQLSNKKIKAAHEKIETKQLAIDEIAAVLEKNKSELERKKVELTEVIKDTDKKEKQLCKKSDTARKSVVSRLLTAYDKIRSTYRNGLAVVTVERESCGGCFNMVPPQTKLEIGLRKKIIACEHCGRILVDDDVLQDQPAETAQQTA